MSLAPGSHSHCLLSLKILSSHRACPFVLHGDLSCRIRLDGYLDEWKDRVACGLSPAHEVPFASQSSGSIAVCVGERPVPCEVTLVVLFPFPCGHL